MEKVLYLVGKDVDMGNKDEENQENSIVQSKE